MGWFRKDEIDQLVDDLDKAASRAGHLDGEWYVTVKCFPGESFKWKWRIDTHQIDPDQSFVKSYEYLHGVDGGSASTRFGARWAARRSIKKKQRSTTGTVEQFVV